MSESKLAEQVLRALTRMELSIGELSARVERLVKKAPARDFYTVKQMADLLGKKEYTVREWCRLGRVQGKKLAGGRGNEGEWRVPHEELVRYQNEGLLPISAHAALRY